MLAQITRDARPMLAQIARDARPMLADARRCSQKLARNCSLQAANTDLGLLPRVWLEGALLALPVRAKVKDNDFFKRLIGLLLSR